MCIFSLSCVTGADRDKDFFDQWDIDLMKTRALALTLVIATGSLAEAATMTFEHSHADPSGFYRWQYEEAGISADGGIIAVDPVVTDANGSKQLLLGFRDLRNPEAVNFTMATPFNAISFFASGTGKKDLPCANTDEAIDAGGDYIISCGLPERFESMKAQGFKDGNLIAEQSIYAPATGALITLGDAFRGLTSLAIFPSVTPPDGLNVDFTCVDPCYQISLDNITFSTAPPAPVPLPGALPLLVTGAAAIALAGRRRRLRG